jgi:rhodanese-related sulfurtransferase
MLSFLRDLLGTASKFNLSELPSNGAIILDVRTQTEFRSDHIEGSINIPLDQLSRNISKLNKGKPIITCCASGARSSIARNILIRNGFAEVYNGGRFARLRKRLRK